MILSEEKGNGELSVDSIVEKKKVHQHYKFHGFEFIDYNVNRNQKSDV